MWERLTVPCYMSSLQRVTRATELEDMGGISTPIYLHLSDLERAKLLICQTLIILKGRTIELRHMLLLTTNRKSYMGSPAIS